MPAWSRWSVAPSRPSRMPLQSLAGVCVALLACGTPAVDSAAPRTADAAGVQLPDTSTVAGVLILRHSAEAVAGAPTLSLDPTPLTIYHDGGGTWDLTRVDQMAGLTTGHVVAAGTLDQVALRLFAPDGTPERLLAERGEGPGEIGASTTIAFHMVGDTVVVFDRWLRRVSRYTAAGFLDAEPWGMATESGSRCLDPAGYLTGTARWVFRCWGVAPDAGLERPLMGVGVGTPAMAPLVHTLPGRERRRVPQQTTDGMRPVWSTLVFGREGRVVPWDTLLVVAAQDRGYLLELRDTAGTLRSEIVVDLSREPVTAARRAARIDREVAVAGPSEAHGGWAPGELVRQAREQPFPDSLPPHGPLVVGTDGVLWVFSSLYIEDSVWSALGFRADGAIIGRLSGAGNSAFRPFWFGAGEVLVRAEDADGVVRIQRHRIRR